MTKRIQIDSMTREHIEPELYGMLSLQIKKFFYYLDTKIGYQLVEPLGYQLENKLKNNLEKL